MLAPLVGVARLERLAHPFQHALVEMEPDEHAREFFFQRLLTHVLAAALGRTVSIAIGVAGAVVVDVFALLDLGGDRAAAFGAGDEPAGGELAAMPLAILRAFSEDFLL